MNSIQVELDLTLVIIFNKFSFSKADEEFKYPLDPKDAKENVEEVVDIEPIYGYWCSSIQCNRACRIAGRGPGRCRYGVCYCWLP